MCFPDTFDSFPGYENPLYLVSVTTLCFDSFTRYFVIDRGD